MSQDGSPSRTMTTSLVQLYSFGDDVAEAKGVEYSSGPSYKTDLRALAHDLGVDRVELRDMEGDALTIKRPDGRYTMFLNGSHYRARHRFSAAHEMAHILLSSMLSSLPIHRHRFSPDQDPDGKRVEALCDSMASSILMPRRRLIPSSPYRVRRRDASRKSQTTLGSPLKQQHADSLWPHQAGSRFCSGSHKVQVNSST